MKFILIMVWLSAPTTNPVVLGPFDTEKLCVNAAAQLYTQWRGRYISGDFACVPTSYPEEEK